MAYAEVVSVFERLPAVPDDRALPDNLRRGQFRAGWKNATIRGKEYRETALKRPTWNNVGYRFGKVVGPVDDDSIDTAYEHLARLYYGLGPAGQVVGAEDKELSMAFWIFNYNPEKYRLAERLADPNPDITWRVSRFRDEIRPGDIIFIWETGRDRGIRAVLRAEGVPQNMHELESEQPYLMERDTDVACRVHATIIHRDVNLSHSHLRSVPGLENLSVFHGIQRGTNFRVTPEEGEILLELVEQRDRGVPAIPRFNSAFELLSPGETGLFICTDGLNLTINGDGSGESGWWVLDPERHFDRAFIFKRNAVGSEPHEVYSARCTGIEGPDGNRFKLLLEDVRLEGTTLTNWTAFADASQNPIRFLKCPDPIVGESVKDPPARMQCTTTRIVRDTAAARCLKEAYEYRCQVCGERIELGPSSFYAEVHHIHPLGGRPPGLDRHDNMLVVCPTHHAMFDLGVAKFESENKVIISGKTISLNLRHRLAPENLDYHNDEIARRLDRGGAVGNESGPPGISDR
jgi:hypothetical protein